MGCTMASRGSSSEPWPLPRCFPERLAEAQFAGALGTNHFESMNAVSVACLLLLRDGAVLWRVSLETEQRRSKEGNLVRPCLQSWESHLRLQAMPRGRFHQARAAASSSLRPCVLLTTGAMNPPHKDGTVPDRFPQPHNRLVQEGYMLGPKFLRMIKQPVMSFAVC